MIKISKNAESKNPKVAISNEYCFLSKCEVYDVKFIKQQEPSVLASPYILGIKIQGIKWIQ